MSQTASAWLEITERVFGGFHVVENATPDWLVDAETGRRFKVDRLWPELGIALRFKGSLGVPEGVVLDEMDLIEETARDRVRDLLCRQAGIALVVIDADSDAPGEALVEMRTALSAAARRIAQRRVAQEAKLDLLPRIASSKTICRRILDTISVPEDLLSLAQAWQDRQFGPKGSQSPVSYQPGMAVKHSEYGKGLVLRVVPGGGKDETEIVVQFSDDSMRIFSSDQADRELHVRR